MRSAYRFLIALGLGSCLLGSAPAWVPSEGVGRVHMPISCTPVQSEFDRGLALLHSFWYDRSRAVFDDIIASHPDCQIAYWGAAMTLNHPLWAPPSTKDRAGALAYIARGHKAATYSEREAKYFHAVTTLFGDGSADGKAVRDTAYMQEMQQLYVAYPDDETALFYALSIEGAPGYRRSPDRIELAGSLLAAVHAHQPQHPGALHYTIHAYDEPGNEQRALESARLYAASAPAIPHALHMPSHTFLALGLWEESNRTNRRAFAASEASVRAAKEPDYDRDFHTLWFLIYGDLQAGHAQEAKHYALIALREYQKVRPLYAKMPKEQANDTFDIGELATSVTTYAYETGDYSMVSKLSTTGLDGAWLAAEDEAAAFGAEASHNMLKAKNARDQLSAYESTFVGRPAAKLYLEIADAEMSGQYAIAQGDQAAGLVSLRSAAALEDQLPATGIGVQQPAYIPPANEMLGLELLREKRYGDAAQAFAEALRLTPNRPKAVAGLAEARAHL